MDSKFSKGQCDTQDAFNFGRDNLGPAIAEYLQDLENTLHYFSKNKNAKILFCARAGVRIRTALSVFCGRTGRSLPDSWENFWVSRIMIAKGIWTRTPEDAAELFDKEYKHLPLKAACVSIAAGGKGQPVQEMPYSRKPSKVGKALLKDKPRTRAAVDHLKQQSELFQDYVSGLVGDHESAVLVDTGWLGTSQSLLRRGFPEYRWFGAYFGLSAVEQHAEDRSHWADAIGLVFQADQVDPAKPETCVIEHRHMIEDLFEPNGPSIESFERDSSGDLVAVGAAENLGELVNIETDPLFAGVLEHLSAAPTDPAQVTAAAQAAWKRLQKFVLTPTLEDTKFYQNTTRSADFGKTLSVPVLKFKEDGDTANNRIAQALWKAGQIAVEYTDGMANTVQRRRFGLDFNWQIEKKQTQVQDPNQPKVAIITRTMDRPMILRRALLSVHEQTFRDYVQIVVCDGGDIDLIHHTIASTNVEHEKIILVDNGKNRGMEAASNVAIAATDSEYIVIHDDDDTWQPEFLQRMVGFLDEDTSQNYGGVLCKSLYVSESVHPDGIQVHGVWPYRDDLRPPTVQGMMNMNTFAPISFLFRRKVYEEIGGFHEDYPVLGDWEFNLRFLERCDIALIEEYLANYHHRDQGDTATFGNSVVAGIDKHKKQLSIMRNAFLRRAANGSVEAATSNALDIGKEI